MDTANTMNLIVSDMNDAFRACERLSAGSIPFDYSILNGNISIRLKDFTLASQIMNTPVKISYQMGKTSLESIKSELIETLNLCDEYFNSRADVDSDENGFVPNEEMQILTQIRSSLGDPSYHY